MPDLEIPDDGYVTVRIGGAESPVDLYGSYCATQAVRARFPDELSHEQLGEFAAALKEYLATVGFPGVSLLAARRFYDAVTLAAEGARGNASAGPTPGSPDSTEPPPSDSPAA